MSVTSGRKVSDRANRYRANRILEQIPEEHRTVCHFCGEPAAELMAGHLDGREENNDPHNISPTCRPCNNEIASNFARLDIGRRTAQYNPEKPAASPLQYNWCTEALKHSRKVKVVQAAIALIQRTPHEYRNRWAGWA